MAMWPSSVGYYFGNPESKYFGLGKIKKIRLIMLSVEVYQLK
jgi:5-methyltetrahydrofolate--homocysteine methyltransferase